MLHPIVYVPCCIEVFYYGSALHYIGKVLLHTHACSGIVYLQRLYLIGYSFTKVNPTYPSKSVLLYACNFTRVRHSHIRERMCYKYPVWKEIVKKIVTVTCGFLLFERPAHKLYQERYQIRISYYVTFDMLYK